MLWFDVEKKYKTIVMLPGWQASRLWFDVEKKYKTIAVKRQLKEQCCGLM